MLYPHFLKSRRVRTTAIVVATTTALLGTAACSGGRSDSSGEEQTRTAANGVLDLSECKNYEATQGVTDTEIKLGTTVPLTGPLGHPEIANAEKAYYDYANDQLDGVDGRKITYEIKDDAYQPATAQQNVRELIDGSKVFAISGAFGTAPVLGFWDLTNERCIPNLYVKSGASELGDPQDHPWTIPFVAPYAGESIVFAEYIKEKPEIETVAVLAMDGDLGEAYTFALEAALEGTDKQIVKTESYAISDPTVSTQMGILAQTDADALFIGGLGSQVPEAIDTAAELGWSPLVFVSGPAATSGRVAVAKPSKDLKILTTGYLMDPNDPRWDGEEAMETYRSALAKYAPDVDPSLYNSALGWTVGALTYEVLKSSPKLTRLDVMATARTLQAGSVGLLLPGIEFDMEPTDPVALTQLQLELFNPETGLFQLVDGDTVLDGTETALIDFSEGFAKFLG